MRKMRPPEITTCGRDVRTRFTDLLNTLDKVAPRHTEERLDALQELSDLTLTHGEKIAFIARLAGILDRRTKEGIVESTARAFRTLVFAGPAIGTVVWLIALVAWEAMRSSFEGFLSGFYVVIGIVLLTMAALPFVAPLFIAASRRANNRVRARSARLLGDLADRSALTAIATASRDLNTRVSSESLAALARLLPLALHPDAPLLSISETDPLIRLLPKVSQDLCLTILEVIEAAGSPAYIHDLEEFEVAEHDTPMGEAARRALVRLYERAEEVRRRETLLRPSTEPETTLLHPVLNMAADERLLLRLPVED